MNKYFILGLCSLTIQSPSVILHQSPANTIIQANDPNWANAKMENMQHRIKQSQTQEQQSDEEKKLYEWIQTVNTQRNKNKEQNAMQNTLAHLKTAYNLQNTSLLIKNIMSIPNKNITQHLYLELYNMIQNLIADAQPILLTELNQTTNLASLISNLTTLVPHIDFLEHEVQTSNGTHAL